MDRALVSIDIVFSVKILYTHPSMLTDPRNAFPNQPTYMLKLYANFETLKSQLLLAAVMISRVMTFNKGIFG